MFLAASGFIVLLHNIPIIALHVVAMLTLSATLLFIIGFLLDCYFCPVFRPIGQLVSFSQLAAAAAGRLACVVAPQSMSNCGTIKCDETYQLDTL